MIEPGSKIWEHTIETVSFLAAAALAAVAVLPGMGVPAWPIPTVAAAGGAVASFLIWCLTGSARFSCIVLTFGCALAGWSTWAELAGVWQPPVLVGWLIGLAVFIPLTALGAAHGRDTRAEAMNPRPGADPAAAEREKLEQWEYMFSRVGCDGVEVISEVTELSGRVVRLNLPRSGEITMARLREATHQIEVILRLKGGRVEFEEGQHSADVIMRLRERDFLAKTAELAPQHRATTINKPFAVGIQEDGSLAMITLRGLHAMIIGITDSGKSNLINVILAQLCGMVDTVVWVIDMKGGRVAKPWLRPYLDGRASTPAIDWIATTRAEAALMMQCFVAAADTRMNSGMGGSKIVPSASVPQIILITDEMADLFGQFKGKKKNIGEGELTNAEFIEMGETITQKGRSEALSWIGASQRGTNSMAGSGDMKANCKLRITLGTATEAEARYVNPDSRTAQKRAAAQVDTPGAGVITMGKKTSLNTKFFLFDHPAKPGTETGETLCDNGCVPACPVYRVALETAGVRPRLDRITAEGMGADYAERWSRAAQVLRRPAPISGAERPAPAEVDTSTFDEIMRSGGVKDPEARLTPWQKRALDILSKRGVQGASPGLLHGELGKEGLAPERETLQRWLRKAEEAGLIHNATFGRWKIGSREDADAA